MSQHDESKRWAEYYKALAGRLPRPLCLSALGCFPPRDSLYQAIDLGCGDGTETRAFLAQGWQVLAIDKQPEAIARVLASVPAADHERLQTQIAGFEAVVLPPADLVYAGFSIPFCRPESFASLWAGIVAAVRPGGRFAGHLFGDRDSWANQPHMTFHTVAEARALFQEFELEVFEEVDQDGQAVSGPKHWHFYEVIARKPGEL